MKKILIAITAMLMLASCKSYLDIKPYGKVIPKTAEEFSALLHEILDKIDYGEETVIGNISSTVYLECYADNLATNLTQYPGGNYIPLYIGTQLSSKQSLYSNLYGVIRDCNIIIGNMNERETRVGRNVLGTAYALRGVCYYNLLRDFAQPYCAGKSIPGVPLVTEFDMEARPTRSSYEKTVEQIVSDLNKAIEYDIQDEMYRFNSEVAEGYLARVYFWTQKYDLAAQYASELLAQEPLLDTAAYQVMIQSQVQRKGNMILKSGVLTETGMNTSNSALKSYLKSRPCSKQFFELFGKTDAERQQDVRFACSVDKKRLPVKNVFSCMRSAEMQLILAESYYHMDKKDKALVCLNELRKKRIAKVVDYTDSTLPAVDEEDLIKVDAKGNPLTPLLYAILTERRKELFLEGDRWYELKRNGCPEFWVAKQGMKYYTRAYMYTFPLYSTDVSLVEGLEQNPGYDKLQ